MKTTPPSCPPDPKRLFALDLLRVLACFLVIWQHVIEPYYAYPDLTIVRNADTPIVGWINSLTPIEVPLFVMISGYFLLPLREETGTFFRKRFTRVLFPFICWCAVYAVYYVFQRGDTWQECLIHICQIPVNFGTEIGHLWFVYMLLGLYLLVPVLSPWLQQCSQKQLRAYLVLWGFTTCLSYIHLFFPQILGECFWNPTPMLHYFTGFVGYFLLGYYIRRYGALSVRTSLIMLVTGYLVTVCIYQYRLPRVSSMSDLEVCWRFCGINIAIMAYAVFSLVSRIRWKGNNAIGHFITRFSLLSYAVYLSHMIFINLYRELLEDTLGRVYYQVPLITLCSFLTSFIIVWLLSYLPKAKYWLGS